MAAAFDPVSARRCAREGQACSGFDERFDATLRRYQLPLFVAVAVVGLILAWFNRFVQDDAFISFVYARNLVNGEGLTWFGARVEGFTNFLWVLWIAAGLKIGREPVSWSYLGGMLSFGLALFATWRLGLALFDRAMPGLLALLLFITNYTVVCYATSGLETMLQTALLTVGALLAERSCRIRVGQGRIAGALSLALAAAVMTRPDSALPGVIIASWAMIGMLRRKIGPRPHLALALPFTLIVGSWVAWRLLYYGRLFPNTFYVKAAWNQAMLGNGLLFVGRFLQWYLLWPFFAIGLLLLTLHRLELGRDDFRTGLVPLGLIVLSWLAYVVSIGGDFMEFRMLVPITPLLFLLLSYLVLYPIGTALGRRRVFAALLALAVLVPMSVRHGVSFRSLTEDKTLDSVNVLGHFYGAYPDGDWSVLGEALRTKLGDTDPVLALHAVGAIPFYSGFRTVDQLGLTDRYVAEHGNLAPAQYRRPGHQRHAPVRYLRERGVNFIIGHPTLVPLDLLESPYAGQFLDRWIPGAVEFETEPVPEISLVLLPVGPRLGLLLWYLMPKLEIDALIAANHWPIKTFQAKVTTAQGK